MSEIGQLGFMSLGFAIQARVGICRRRMRVVASLSAAERHHRIAGIGGRIDRRRVTRVKLFCPAQASSRVPSTVKVLIGRQPRVARLAPDRIEEHRGDIARQRPLTISAERRRRPHGIIQVQSDEPANSRLYCSSSISGRSLRTEYSTCRSKARNTCSGGTEGRPIFS